MQARFAPCMRAHGCRAAPDLTIAAAAPIYVASHNHHESLNMSNNTRHSFVSEILTVIGDALASASAVQQGRQPRAKNLRGLGIDPAQFRKIGRYY